ncbi:hypothetical protein Q5692_24495, partial [Microcoleus sp. C2C3]|uniref:hypothetical protein n=1 Tax=unclassified Microcoleus TaxID=2642155 RepID=UPI002FD613FA
HFSVLLRKRCLPKASHPSLKTVRSIDPTTSNKENYLGDLGFKVKTLKFGQPVHSAHPTNSIGVQFL